MTLKTLNRLVAIVGRPNVGKSTLFNRMIKQRKSLVFDEPGITRDRIFGKANFEGKSFYLCDTGGFEPTNKNNIKVQLVEQAEIAIEEAEVVILVTDGREGIHPIDQELLKKLRKANKPFYLCINKCDNPKEQVGAEEFRKLGVSEIFPVSAEHNLGIGALLEKVTETFPVQKEDSRANEKTIKLAIIGRPNVGKSSILNRLVGETRSIVDDVPGTTRDNVDVFLTYFGQQIQIIDTAGIRRKSRMSDVIEKYSALRSVTCLEECNIAVLVIDALEGPTEGDARVAGYAFEMRKPILIVVNKWDLIKDKNSNSMNEFIDNLKVGLRYLRYAPVLFISAVENQRVSKIIPQCISLYEEGRKRASTAQVNRMLKEVLIKHTPPLVKNKSKKIKFFYATQVGTLPPRFVVFCSHPQELHFSYKRFLENEFREQLGFENLPISLIFRERNQPQEPKDLMEMDENTIKEERKRLVAHLDGEQVDQTDLELPDENWEEFEFTFEEDSK